MYFNDVMTVLKRSFDVPLKNLQVVFAKIKAAELETKSVEVLLIQEESKVSRAHYFHRREELVRCQG